MILGNESQLSDRRRFVRKLASLAALGGLTGWLLSQAAEPVRAVSAGDIAYWNGVSNSYDDTFYWDTADRILHVNGEIAVNILGTPSNIVEVSAGQQTDGGITIDGTGTASGFSDLGLRIRNFTAHGAEWYIDSTGDDGAGNHSLYGSGRLAFVSPVGGAPTMTLTPNVSGNGAVGIDTTNPLGPLHVHAANDVIVAADGRVGVGVNPNIPASSGGTTLQVHAATNENFVSRDANIALGKSPGTFQGVSFQGVNDANTANNMLAFIGSPVVIAGGNVFIGPVAPSSLPTHQLDMAQGAFCTGTVWTNACDRNLKENFTPLDENEILNRLESVPIQKWNYKNEPQADHIGPVAQDFYAAYQLGDSEKSIGTVDADGVAFAAIKALHKTLREQQERIAVLERTVKQLAS